MNLGLLAQRLRHYQCITSSVSFYVYSDEDLKAVKKYKDHEYAAQYSPWSCDTIGSYIGSQNAQPKDIMPSSGMEMNNVDSKGLREQLMNLDLQRRAAESKEEDPIIPFGELPTVSKFGAISRTSKTSYQTTGPVQAVASQGIATKPISVSGIMTARLNHIRSFLSYERAALWPSGTMATFLPICCFE
eukprot:g38138.t1